MGHQRAKAISGLEMKSGKFLSIIPARGGSRGIIRKNVTPLAGKPLLAWTIEASLSANCIDYTYVSSDDTEILEVAAGYGAKCIVRPESCSNDEASSESVISHFISSLEAQSLSYKYIVLLQPTSPLRTSSDIDNAIKAFCEDENSTALISVFEPDHSVLKAFVVNKKGYLQGIRNNEEPFMRRQDLPKSYMPNGAIYIVNLDEFIENEKLFTKNTMYYLMSTEKSLDIDDIEDIKKAEALLKYCVHTKKHGSET